MSGGDYGTGITSLKLQILSRSSRNWFDITPVAGTKKRLTPERQSFLFYSLRGADPLKLPCVGLAPSEIPSV